MYPNAFYRVSAKALVMDGQKRVLVIKENQETWSLPGGGLEHGEDPREGVSRELKEELGVESVNVQDIVAVKTFYLKQKSAWVLWVVYRVGIEKNQFIFGEGVKDAQFIDRADLAKSNDIFERLVYEISRNES